MHCIISAAVPAHARLGSTAFLSWKLPRPGLGEFTVRRLSSKSLFHITDYNQVNVTDRYKSRAAFTGRVNSSGSGVFSFELYNVDWPDSAEYRCHRGSPGSPGSRVYDCGQRLFVKYIADPYIVAPQTVEADKIVTLTCYVAVKGYLQTSITWGWRRNEVEVANIERLPLAVSKLHGDYYYHKGSLTVSDGTRGRYTCKAELVGWDVQSEWSEESELSTNSKMEKVPNYTQVREGDHAMVAWKMPRYRYEFYIMTPSGDKFMAVDANKVYILPKYWLRTRMVEVVTSRNTSTYVFCLYNVSLADAGRYTCRREEKGATKISLTRCIHDLFVSSHNATATKPVMTSPNKYGYAVLIGILVAVLILYLLTNGKTKFDRVYSLEIIYSE
ncbi:uncharacterized protein LOC124150164 [Haliotis rufescens]|uniref:uncharacterized protein LOC124150164 n=1 Tax=Haliotis rufescens TaxID=6454 RepID=UPI00201EC392|nr:uncharacterized protein LOC124150164 [Haliotis rufescens]